MLHKMKISLITIVILGIFFSGIGFANASLWKETNTRLLKLDSLPGVIPEGKDLKPLLFGFDHMGSDIYWVKMVLYTGGNALDEKKLSLYSFASLITDLDPKFWGAYRQAILILPDTGQKEETKSLLKKAEQNLPNRWEPFYRGGFYYYFYEDDYDTAIEKYKKCTEISGCLAGAERMIRNLETRRGKYFVAIEQYLSELQNPKISDDDYDLFRKKVEESAKLLVLNDAAKKFVAQEKSLTQLSDLENFSFVPDQETQKVINLIRNNPSLFPFQFSEKKGKVLIDKKTLLPAFAVNEMEWSGKENRVRTQRF